MNIIRTRIGNMIYFHQPTDEPFDPEIDESYVAVNLDEQACAFNINEGYVVRRELQSFLQMLVDVNNALLLET